MPTHTENNSLRKRAKRYAKVSTTVASVGAQVIGARTMGGGSNSPKEAALFRAALGGLKGPLMKVAQLAASIPDFLPPEHAAALMALQADAPSMGWPFVRRRMMAELGADWQARFKSFEQKAAAAASLGQVHRAVAKDDRALACKLQYPDMESVVEADLQQLKMIFGLIERFDGALRTKDVFHEIADRLREELDYRREARNMNLYHDMLAEVDGVHVPEPVPELSTARLLTMTWLYGEKLVDIVGSRDQAARNAIAINMFRLWYTPFYQYGVIHGDPHLGNYTVRADNSINLLDFGCIRVFRPELVHAVVMLYFALRDKNEAQAVEAYKLWGFKNPTKELIDVLSVWARFVYAPLLEDRIQSVEETNATAYGRETAGKVHRALKKIGGVTIPPEFVLLDRASIGLGSVFLRLKAEVNWFQLFHTMTSDFDVEKIRERQKSNAL